MDGANPRPWFNLNNALEAEYALLACVVRPDWSAPETCGSPLAELARPRGLERAGARAVRGSADDVILRDLYLEAIS